MSTRRANHLLRLLPPIASALLLCGGLAAGLTPPPSAPVPPIRQVNRPATPVESLTHQLEQAYLRDQITGPR